MCLSSEDPKVKNRNEKTIQIAVVGTGYFGAELCDMKKNDGAVITVVYDPKCRS